MNLFTPEGPHGTKRHPTMNVREISDKTTLHRYLITDPVVAAYHLGDLDDRYFPFCRWWGADGEDGELKSVILLYSGLRLPAVLALGDPEGVDQILESPAVQHELPGRFYAHVLNGHLASLQHHYNVDKMISMVRMGLRREDYTRPERELNGVETVSHSDTAELMSLYRYYPDNFFEPYQLETGYYYGLREAGRLVSVAGIHVYSEQYDIAAIGNIVTHPDHRCKGYSSRCTSRLLRSLLERVSLVALNVQRDNAAARTVYKRLGFHDHAKYVEGLVTRR